MNVVKVHLLERGKSKGGRKKDGKKQASYYVKKWRDTNGQWVYESIGRTKKSGGSITLAMAEKACSDKAADINGGRIGRDRPDKMTLAAFIDYHERSERLAVRASTLAGWRTAGKHAVAALGSETQLDEIRRDDKGRIEEYLIGRGRSAMTVRKTLVILRAMLNSAVRYKLIHENPFTGMRLAPMTAREKRIFSPADVASMVKVSDSWWSAFILLGYTTD